MRGNCTRPRFANCSSTSLVEKAVDGAEVHKRQITLSRAITELNDRACVVDTILHEIAHALVGPATITMPYGGSAR